MSGLNITIIFRQHENSAITKTSDDVSVCKQRLQENGKETVGDEEMNNKPTPDITPNLAISSYYVLQKYCTGQPADCKGCGFYEHCPECFQGIPCDWSLNEEGEINEAEKGNTD